MAQTQTPTHVTISVEEYQKLQGAGQKPSEAYIARVRAEAQRLGDASVRKAFQALKRETYGRGHMEPLEEWYERVNEHARSDKFRAAPPAYAAVPDLEKAWYEGFDTGARWVLPDIDRVNADGAQHARDQGAQVQLVGRTFQDFDKGIAPEIPG